MIEFSFFVPMTPPMIRSDVPSKAPYYLLLVLTLMVWSNSFTAIQVALRYLSPVQLLCARFLPVGLFCTGYVLFRRRETFPMLRKEGWKLSAMGILSVAAYNYFLYTGETHIPAGTAAILVATNPLQTYLLAAVFLGERIRFLRSVGFLVAFVGLYVVVVHGTHVEVGVPYIRYALITLLAPLAWAVYTLMSKTLLHRYRPLPVTYLSLALGSLPVYAFLGKDFTDSLLAMPMKGWISVAYLAIFCTLFGFFAWSLALRRLQASETASFVYLNPPLAVLSAAFFLGQPIRVTLVTGLILVLFGIYLGTRMKEKNKEANQTRPLTPGVGVRAE